MPPAKNLGTISTIIRAVSGEAIRGFLFHLAEDPIPCRTLNYTRPGRDQCTLYDADDLIQGVLESGGYDVTVATVPVQAFVPDTGVAWGFRKPLPDEPWYEARNIQAFKMGNVSPSELVVILAHKDSQSWLERGPGAYDNAAGVAALLEISRLLAPLELARSAILLFCNEEHWPWTSVQAAKAIAKSNHNVAAVLNLDSIGGKSAADISDGRLPAAVRFSSRGQRPASFRCLAGFQSPGSSS
ncbi:MAG TPA: M28 family peptidase [Rhodothermales bacterium]|nr:M28 family peptidase [Rhodothermales bacterium]